MILKCQGKDDEADVLYEYIKKECGKQEVYFQTCYGQMLLCHAMHVVFGNRTRITEPLIY